MEKWRIKKPKAKKKRHSVFNTQPSYLNTSSQRSLIENASNYLQKNLMNFKEQSYTDILRAAKYERS